jgi:NTE family protein
VDADLVLEGGGVKGSGLVGAVAAFEQAGYSFHRVAGTSAGAIVASLLAANMPADKMRDTLLATDFSTFEDGGLFLSHLGLLGQGVSLLFEKGLYKGDVLHAWIKALLADMGVQTFGQLKITDDPNSSVPPERNYRLVVIVSDVSRGELLHLPWDYARFGLDPDSQSVADAVRASASIPFFFDPVILTEQATKQRTYLVDGGLLSNFPIDVFDRTDGQPPRWPTFGVKLSAKPDANQVPHPVNNTLELAEALIGTMSNAHDQMHLNEPSVLARTMFVDTAKVNSTNFSIDQQTRQWLYDEGFKAGNEFLKNWNFNNYIQMHRTAP